jgi:pyruvate,water dikinase
MRMRSILWPDDPAPAARLGRKAAGLAALQRVGLPVPTWFVLAPEACPADLLSVGEGVSAAGGRRLAAGPTLSLDVTRELAQALARLCPEGELLAVRSSAVDEDGAEHSFAGQLESFLGVRPDEVPERALAVWRSALSDRARAYRRAREIASPPRPPAVLIQRMLDADAAGVAFSADPVGGRRDVAVVSAVHGLGVGLVSGEAAADTYRVDLDERPIAREVADKRLAYRSPPAGGTGLRLTTLPPEDAAQPVLSDEQARAVAALARRCERHFGCPQDIEWALAGGRLFLLQSRPITTLAGTPDPGGARRLWDNSNISESYAGVTTPLTFSFARKAYAEVYREFCRLMGVPANTVATHAGTFGGMLGLIEGRIYYNLLNWYRVLAMLPGFRFNHRFMEQMMGVREGLPPEILSEIIPPSPGARLRDSLRFLGTVFGLAWNLVFLPWRIRLFRKRLEEALGSPQLPLESLDVDALVEHYRGLERQLLTRWDAPLVNDFFGMIGHGVLQDLVTRWCPGLGPGLSNELLCGEGGVISAEPAARILALAETAREDRRFVGLLCEGSPAQILDRLPALPAFEARYRAYLDAFGDRCLGELKLESLSLHDDPLPLLRAVGRRAAHDAAPPAERTPQQAPASRTGAKAQIRGALGGHPLRRLLLAALLRFARGRIRDRENLRFQRTRIFGRVRRIFLELGKRLASQGMLDEPRDVFFLEVDEVLGSVEGTATTRNLRGLTVLRKAEYQSYQTASPPPDRFETRGLVARGRSAGAGVLPPAGPSENRIEGVGCSAGVVRGRARLVTDPHTATIRPGEILVAERTDPGWVTLFASAAGLLTERGSLLSHVAIVARELGIPAVTCLPGLTRWLRDGDWLEIDGRTGQVRRVEVAPHAD